MSTQAIVSLRSSLELTINQKQNKKDQYSTQYKVIRGDQYAYSSEGRRCSTAEKNTNTTPSIPVYMVPMHFEVQVSPSFDK
jgi:hypothetical protein